MSFARTQNINNSFFDGYYKDIWRAIIPEALTKAEVDYVVSEGELRAGSKVLDLMCGYGRHALSLARKGMNVTAIDNLTDYIDEIKQIAEKENARLRLFEIQIRTIPQRIGAARVEKCPPTGSLLRHDVGERGRRSVRSPDQAGVDLMLAAMSKDLVAERILPDQPGGGQWKRRATFGEINQSVIRRAARAWRLAENIAKTLRLRININDFDLINNPVAAGKNAATGVGGGAFHLSTDAGVSERKPRAANKNFVTKSREKASNPKLQSPENLQTPNIQSMNSFYADSIYRLRIGVWSLELLWSLDVGAC